MIYPFLANQILIDALFNSSPQCPPLRARGPPNVLFGRWPPSLSIKKLYGSSNLYKFLFRSYNLWTWTEKEPGGSAPDFTSWLPRPFGVYFVGKRIIHLTCWPRPSSRGRHSSQVVQVARPGATVFSRAPSRPERRPSPLPPTRFPNSGAAVCITLFFYTNRL